MMDLKTHYRQGLAIPGTFTILYWLTQASWLIWVGAILTLLWLIPFTGRYVLPLWLKGTRWIGHWNNRILLSLIFFLLLTPLAWLKRLSKWNKPRDNWKNKDSGFVLKNREYSREDLKNLW